MDVPRGWDRLVHHCHRRPSARYHLGRDGRPPARCCLLVDLRPGVRESRLSDGAAGGFSTSSWAIFFAGGAIWCFVAPFDAFWSLAAALGLLLIIKGAFDISYAAMSRAINPLWWLGLVTGLLEIGLGFWASQQYVQARAALLLLWVGFYAIFRGISDLVIAFEVRPAR